jgi:hypothetical protein
MHALAPLEKIFFLVGAAFLSVLGHVHTGSLAKAGKDPPDHTLKRHGLRRVFSVQVYARAKSQERAFYS